MLYFMLYSLLFMLYSLLFVIEKVLTDTGKSIMCSNSNKRLTVKDMETTHIDLQKRKVKSREK